MYNVERYLADCLSSVLNEDFKDLEIVLVDDGSTDQSGVIAEKYVREHDNVRLVRTDNQGPGAARNIGVHHARGELLAFVDSDDTVPAWSHHLMVTTLDKSGSDFAVGSVLRPFDSGVAEPPWLRPLHEQPRIGVSIDGFPPILHDIFVWNKVFRRSFWDSAGLRFPEGVLYEDQVTITEAYLKASSLDVLKQPVYQWRIRTDASSITQQRHELRDLQDRLVTKQMTTDIVRRLGSQAVRDEWFQLGLVADLPLYFRRISTCNDKYWKTLRAGIEQLFDGAPPIEQSRLGVVQRLIGWLIIRGRLADAQAVLAFVDAHPVDPSQDVGLNKLRAHLLSIVEPDSDMPTELSRWLITS